MKNREALKELDLLDEECELTSKDYINEDLQEIHDKFYNNLPIDEFKKIVAIDPTYKEGSEKFGSFGKWLLTLKKKGQDLSDIQEIRDQLNIFNKVKQKLPADRRDINRYKSFEELMSYLSQHDLANKSDTQIKNEQVKGVTFVASHKPYDIYTPETWEASKYLRGQNAVWCTGRHSDDGHWRYYTGENCSEGRLYIFQNTVNADDKYQAYIKTGSDHINEFRDKNNDSVDFVDFILTRDLVNTLAALPQFKNIKELTTAKQLQELKDGKPLTYKGELYIDDRVKKYIVNVVIDPRVTAIASRVFAGCSRLEKIDIPTSVKELGIGAFKRCDGLKEVKLPEGIKELPDMIFMDCRNLESVFIPDSVVAIGAYAFAGCDKANITAHKHKMSVRTIDLNYLTKHLTFIK